ncbi:hypothetical protein [Streptomyces carpinensis]|uniref:Regulatory protein n=1 Tax=Streptomyces carpinensis TaxID=66369 RepID=A0ABV1W5S5_9ACTN|nr:hypothetical protein [Streptomyces carpinensis]
MSQIDTAASGLTSQYAAQVAGDLERNVKEQERLSEEIAALQEQLAALQQDHAVLVNVQQALGVAGAPRTSAPEPAAVAVPAPRKKSAPATGAGRSKQTTKKSAAPARKTADKKGSTPKAAGKSADSASTRPTLVEIVRDYLTAQREPRSAAEITTELGQRHPERTIKTTVVRTTLEGLVAKNQAQRSKQGTSVFYTTGEASGPAAGSESSKEQQPAST